MGDEFEAVVSTIRDRVTPDGTERERLDQVADRLIDVADHAVDDLPVEADVLLVGSAARDTWLSGDRDVDVFVRFPPSLDREELERYGLAVGRQVLPDGREEYAEHPYITGEYEGFDVDLVPCYAVEDATDIRSSVDRTPFHTEYLSGRIDPGLAGEIRVCKRFLAGIGAYGSDLRTRGFSGYLVELLVLEYGTFRDLVEAGADWHPPVRLDPEDHGERTFDDPLVLVDPTDPRRNVAAALSATNLARFQHYARELLADPREELFATDHPDPLSPEEIRSQLRARGTTPIAVRFDAPDVVEDQLYPQLRKSIEGVVGELDRRGFDVLRTATFADESAVLFAELSVVERPAVERHRGPPVHVREHAQAFFEQYADADVYGPFIDGERYVVERDRRFTRAASLLESDVLFGVGLGADVRRALDDGYEVLVGDEVADLAGEFGVQLARYFSPKP